MVLYKLKELARKFSIAVVVMAELKKAPENKKASNRMPQLSDLKDSGFTDHEADVVLFLYRPEYYDKTQSEYGGSLTWEAHIHIAKNGMGPLETFRLKALVHIQKFIEYDEDLFYEGQQTAETD